MAIPVEFTISEALRDCLEAALAERPNPPAEVCLRVGQEVFLGVSLTEDECCSGLGWVRVAEFFPSADAFPAQDETFTPCGPFQYAVELEMGVARCAPQGEGNLLPACADWTDSALQLAYDRQAMSAAVCCLRGQFKTLLGDANVPWVTRPWVTSNNEGGCVGGTMRVVVSVLESCC